MNPSKGKQSCNHHVAKTILKKCDYNFIYLLDECVGVLCSVLMF